MAVYVCTKHPWLGFYIEPTTRPGPDGRPVEVKEVVRYRFQGGEFDTAQYPKELQPQLEATLQKLTEGAIGVVVKPETRLAFVCPACSAGFPTQARLDAHKPKHKSQAEIVAESVREGSRTTPSTE